MPNRASDTVTVVGEVAELYENPHSVKLVVDTGAVTEEVLVTKRTKLGLGVEPLKLKGKTVKADCKLVPSKNPEYGPSLFADKVSFASDPAVRQAPARQAPASGKSVGDAADVYLQMSAVFARLSKELLALAERVGHTTVGEAVDDEDYDPFAEE